MQTKSVELGWVTTSSAGPKNHLLFWLGCVKVSIMPITEPSLFDQTDPDTEEAALQEAEEAIAAGRVVSHEAVVRWLRSWGTPDELPRPKCGE